MSSEIVLLFLHFVAYTWKILVFLSSLANQFNLNFCFQWHASASTTSSIFLEILRILAALFLCPYDATSCCLFIFIRAMSFPIFSNLLSDHFLRNFSQWVSFQESSTIPVRGLHSHIKSRKRCLIRNHLSSKWNVPPLLSRTFSLSFFPLNRQIGGIWSEPEKSSAPVVELRYFLCHHHSPVPCLAFQISFIKPYKSFIRVCYVIYVANRKGFSKHVHLRLVPSLSSLFFVSIKISLKSPPTNHGLSSHLSISYNFLSNS